MPILKTAEELAFLERVEQKLRNCEFQSDIATAEGLQGGAGALHHKLRRLGFKTDRTGGWHLVDVMLGRDLSDWLKSGELAAAPEELVAA